MLTQAGTPGTDDWLLVSLATEMGMNFPRLGKLRKYRQGDAPVPEEADGQMREAYRAFVKKSRLNMCELIVDAKADRQKPVAFRTAATDDELGDENAWNTWRRSRMAVGSRQMFADAGHYGDAFITVYGADSIPGSLEVLAESRMVVSNGWTTWTREHPRFPWITQYAIEVGFDAVAGLDMILLYGQGWYRMAFRQVRSTTIPSDGSQWRPGADWTWATDRVPLGWTLENPVTRYSTSSRMGIYEPHLDTIDRINDGIKQRSTIQAMQAFRQRAVEGSLPQVYPADHELAGQKIDYNEMFKAGPAALWMLPVGAKVWESAVTDITPLLSGNKEDKKDLATVTSTPLYTLVPDATTGSASGVEASREALVFSVEKLNDIASDALATAHARAFEANNDSARADAATIETVWASVTLAPMLDRAQAAQAAKAGGMSQTHIDEKIFGLTPAEQRAARQYREDEALLAPAA